MATLSELNVPDLPLSNKRIDGFLESYRADRESSSTIENLFERVGAFRHHPQVVKKHLFGIDVLIKKAPFCDLPNWVEYRTWEFAVATERYLFEQFRELIGKPRNPFTKRMTVDELSDAMSQAVDVATESEFHASLLVLIGNLTTDEIVDLYQSNNVVAPWKSDAEYSRRWILGVRDGLPILHLKAEEPPNVCAVDLARLATLTKYGDIEFKITEIDEQRARDIILKKQPDEPVTETAINELRLKVHLRLVESFAFTTHDNRAVFWANRSAIF